MNNFLFTRKIDMDQTKNFTTQLNKIKAERDKEQETSHSIKAVYGFILKAIIFFAQNAVFYAAYQILSTKISMIEFSYIEFLCLQLAGYTILFVFRNLFKPFTNQ
jgi:hypothetical protein